MNSGNTPNREGVACCVPTSLHRRAQAVPHI